MRHHQKKNTGDNGRSGGDVLRAETAPPSYRGGAPSVPGASSTPGASRIPGASSARGPSSRPGEARVPRSLRLTVALSRRRLDRELADGVSAALTARHALRAAQLTSASSRARLAQTLGDMAARAAQPPAAQPRSTYRIEPSRRALANCEGPLRELASRLSEPRPVYARGVAQLLRLVRDGGGPLYTDRHGGSLRAALASIDGALAGHRG